jgi:hypothetical protein
MVEKEVDDESTLPFMARTLLEQRLTDVAERLVVLRRELSVADEQLAHFADEADEARLRALVSETPIADREHREAQRHADAMGRHRTTLQAEISELERTQDDLLDRMIAEGGTA